MGDGKHVHTFDSASYRTTVREMASRGEGVHDEGRRYLQATGTLHPYVDVRKNRGSHNAMVPGDKPNTFVLTNGIALPILSLFDGTGSTSRWLEEFFRAAERQYRLLEGARPRYNTQLASGVVQDVTDSTDVVQISQFESDERSAEQVRLLQPASAGGDATEDYDLGIVMGLFLYADLWTYYGLKGYLTLTLDEIGRGFVTRSGVSKYLGQSLDTIQGGTRMETSEICRRLLDRWHFFVLQVPSGGYDMLSRTTSWWREQAGSGRVIRVDDPRLLADVRAALVYVMEATNPTKPGLVEFLRSNKEQAIDAASLDQVWRMVHAAEEHFGAQAALPGYHDIPLPGDVFAHYRHAWPIGHPREGENITPVDDEATVS